MSEIPLSDNMREAAMELLEEKRQIEGGAAEDALLDARVTQMLDDGPNSPVKNQQDHRIVLNFINQCVKDEGIHTAILCISDKEQAMGGSSVIGPKPNLLEIIKYINGTVLPKIAPRIKIKMIIKRI